MARSRFGGEQDLVTAQRMVEKNPTWNSSAMREGWELMNYGENCVPGSMDEIESKGYPYRKALAQQREEERAYRPVNLIYGLLDALKQKYTLHPEIVSEKIPLRVFKFDADMGFYTLDIPPTLRISKVSPDDPSFAELEAKLEAEPVIENNFDLLRTIHEEFDSVEAVKSKEPFILRTRSDYESSQ
ncbi:hypothetical protein HOK51_05150 [Candidatus Woesearchaeota archaeon]|jgi:hypothetical protein|nr:hypothetical protein [Candidatus Woesearchaeota archaeon]MBT6519214.1 hypothetical protein [Candidatus Woesearchaeota archaeon]MBT7368936.1 hypothetical protein [Candidatus Woesearchaeota archaeon]